MMERWITRHIPWLLVLALFATAVALHLHTALAAPAPEEAIAAALAARDERYAGDCAATVSPRDLGAVCSRLVDERGSVRAYLTGRTFSEFHSWLFVAETDGGWQVVAETPLHFDSTSLEAPWP